MFRCLYDIVLEALLWCACEADVVSGAGKLNIINYFYFTGPCTAEYHAARCYRMIKAPGHESSFATESSHILTIYMTAAAVQISN